jgi:hypothetical protein
VTPIVKVRRAPAILRQIKRGKHNLVVLGVKARTGENSRSAHASQFCWRIRRALC